MASDNQGLLKRLKITSEVLGTGGFARVVKAEFDGSQVALKILLPQWCDPGNARCRAFQGHFIREAKFLERHDHPHIVKCMGLVQLSPNHPGMPSGYSWPAWGMILELGRGGSIAKQVYAQMVQVHSRLYSDRDAVKWMKDVAEALKFLHTLPRPVVHRDMKLENMLIFKEPIPGDKAGFITKIKMADFGLHAELDVNRGSVLRRRTRSNAAGLPKSLSLKPSDMRIEEEPPSSVSPKTIGQAPADGAPTIESMSGGDDVSVRGPSPLQPHLAGQRSKMNLPSKPPTLDVRPQSGMGQVSQSAIIIESSSAASLHRSSSLANQDAVPAASIDGRSSPSPPKSPKEPSSGPREAISVGGVVISKPLGSGLPSQGSISAHEYSVRGNSGEIVKRDSESGGGWAMDRETSGPSLIGSYERPSVVSDVMKRALAQEYEKAFKLTGETGSAIYMSPEVQRHEPYNEKTDVYSFGVMMYEVFARQMIVTTALAADPDAYAIHVSNGFREPKPDRMDPELYKLIDWCRSQDPNERPGINDVIACLDLLSESLVDSKPVSEGCGCIIS